MRAGMLLAAVSCLALGVFPPLVIDWMDAVTQQLVGMKIGSPIGGFGWLWLTPVAAERASYSGGIVFLGLLLCIPAVYSAAPHPSRRRAIACRSGTAVSKSSRRA